MIPTPDLSHLSAKDFDNIYEPAEDTFLLLDALEEDQELIKSLKPSLCLEIGSGSGCVITLLGKIIGNQALYLTSDLNPKACQATYYTGKKNHVDIEPIQTSLVDGLFSRLYQNVDILCFNPPYVVTPSEEVGSLGIEASWAGGIDGREVTDQLLPMVKDLLSPNGIFYLLLINENKPQEVMGILETYGLKSEIMMQRRAGREKQYILKIQK
ncbi:S-adenosyl-L-methionine-dependent methyltransferase [Cunninghamella echinulata]|nr:S-adenosyl-L-methionine-dependent methyltransferase [Cunninghamella echinulata]